MYALSESIFPMCMDLIMGTLRVCYTKSTFYKSQSLYSKITLHNSVGKWMANLERPNSTMFNFINVR